MKDYIEERVLELARYIIDTNSTVRAAAKKFRVSKSTVHKDVTERLLEIPDGPQTSRRSWKTTRPNATCAAAWLRERNINTRRKNKFQKFQSKKHDYGDNPIFQIVLLFFRKDQLSSL